MFKSDFARTAAAMLCTLVVSSTFVLAAVAPAQSATPAVAVARSIA